MTLILDAGAFVAFERGSRDVRTLLGGAFAAGRSPRTHGGVVGQVWRGGARQALIARLLAGTEIVPLDATLGRQAGALLAITGTADVVDAAVVLLARDGDTIVTSDRDDLSVLIWQAGRHVELVAV